MTEMTAVGLAIRLSPESIQDTAGTSLVLRRSGTAGGLVRTIKNLVAILSLMALTATASALGLRLEEFTPVKYFTKEDWSQAKQVAKTALEQGKLDETFDWHNESTGHRGSYTVLRRVELDGRNCGDLLIKHKAGPASARGDYRFCQMPSGEWKAMGRTPSD